MIFYLKLRSINILKDSNRLMEEQVQCIKIYLLVLVTQTLKDKRYHIGCLLKTEEQ